MKLSTIESRNGKDALSKYLARFGDDWVETEAVATTELWKSA
jgi:hypothetical protein